MSRTNAPLTLTHVLTAHQSPVQGWAAVCPKPKRKNVPVDFLIATCTTYSSTLCNYQRQTRALQLSVNALHFSSPLETRKVRAPKSCGWAARARRPDGFYLQSTSTVKWPRFSGVPGNAVCPPPSCGSRHCLRVTTRSSGPKSEADLDARCKNLNVLNSVFANTHYKQHATTVQNPEVPRYEQVASYISYSERELHDRVEVLG